ncbi:hypothetical protein LEP1GSC188_1406 [Leptospira weilii serovar Topaz str. LT2116]|uniref:Uncharacterized protein n=1 Tax=Leptospira weilii serovar Topaz str. LT2116 TaxID=1088540 RepID=M3FTP2_9LEPT|nr:hypothetical protein LEP1GSC188_1406 [Leptospira weilii serovar Topaz str. LT2116]
MNLFRADRFFSALSVSSVTRKNRSIYGENIFQHGSKNPIDIVRI